MAIDTSAVVAIMLDEVAAPRIEQAMEAETPRLMSAATLVELSIVVEARLGEAGGRELDLLLRRAQIEIVPLDEEQAEIARRAWRAFGKGRHPARLNLGDCYSYALSRDRGQPLLFVGGDFSQTDVDSVLDRSRG